MKSNIKIQNLKNHIKLSIPIDNEIDLKNDSERTFFFTKENAEWFRVVCSIAFVNNPNILILLDRRCWDAGDYKININDFNSLISKNYVRFELFNKGTPLDLCSRATQELMRVDALYNHFKFYLKKEWIWNALKEAKW